MTESFVNMKTTRSRRTNGFQQARWNEPILFDLHQPGQRGIDVSRPTEAIELAVGNLEQLAPEGVRRPHPPHLPEIAQIHVLRHFLRLSQENLGADLNVDVGQGTCTMKYTPKINEELVRNPKLSSVHPLQADETVQGSLEILHQTDLFFREISGLDRFSFQPRSGSHAILAMASIVRAWFEHRGDYNERRQIITSLFSHPSDAAAAHVLGFEIVTLNQDPRSGLPTLDRLRSVLSSKTAALFITNPEDTGIFNPRIREFTDAVRDVGGLCCYDQANANGLLGITRAREAGFDMCFFNLHKTFATPHACGGPAAGALGVREPLAPFLPRPTVEYDGAKYYLDHDRTLSVGKIGSFIGVVPAVVRAYAWIRSLGAEGLRAVAETAVLNNNYLMRRVCQQTPATVPFAESRERIEQVRYSWQQLAEETGVGIDDIVRRMCDHGLHLWSSHHPFVVPNPMTLEPTESYSREDLDEYAAALADIAVEARTNPETLRTAPHRSCVHRTEHHWFEDPQRWAVTWRAYQRKLQSGVYDQ